jgi:hypothetical protein
LIFIMNNTEDSLVKFSNPFLVQGLKPTDPTPKNIHL